MLLRLKGVLSAHTDPSTAVRLAFGAGYRSLLQQSALWAYVDNFRFLGYLAFAGLPVTFLLGKAK